MTFGQGLPDALAGKKGDPPSRYAWPSLIARTIKRPVKNFAVPGASNLEILWQISHAEIHPTDHVFVMWSFLERSCILVNEETTRQLGPWIDRQYNEHYYRYCQSDFHDRFMYPILVREADRLLRSKTDRIYYLEAHPSECFPFDLLPIRYETAQPKPGEVPNDISQDRSHPGIISHERLAKAIIKYIGKDVLSR